MTLHLFIGTDLRDLPHDFIFPHENKGMTSICSQLWNRFHHLEDTYALVAAVQRTGTQREVTPDAVLISEMGIGVIELKHHYGEIDCLDREGPWFYADHRPMGMNKNRTLGKEPDYKNPYQQVRTYAAQILNDLKQPGERAWLPGGPADWSTFKLHGAVCFTNPQASLYQCKRVLDPIYRNVTDARILSRMKPEDWSMVFDVISPEEIAEFAFNMRLSAHRGSAEWYNSFRFSPEEVLGLARDFFGGVPWEEMTTMLHAGRPPLGYLVLSEGSHDVQYYPIFDDEVLIGRNPEVCAIPIPSRFAGVSRRHARLVHTPQGFYLSDEGSSHGTYINGVRLRGQVLLGNSSQKIQLGGAEPEHPVCILRFERSIEPRSHDLPTYKVRTE